MQTEAYKRAGVRADHDKHGGGIGGAGAAGSPGDKAPTVVKTKTSITVNGTKVHNTDSDKAVEKKVKEMTGSDDVQAKSDSGEKFITVNGDTAIGTTWSEAIQDGILTSSVKGGSTDPKRFSKENKKTSSARARKKAAAEKRQASPAARKKLKADIESAKRSAAKDARAAELVNRGGGRSRGTSSERAAATARAESSARRVKQLEARLKAAEAASKK